ncbi:MAG: TIGR02757 family protein [Ignavibacteriales bacterium]|nr:TIGR02757 family protein [Ignavibacteriales bacterium]
MIKNNTALKKKLDYHYKFFDCSQISPDPLEFLHKYSGFHDIEIAGILSALFAYGNVKQIISTLEKIHNVMNRKPYEFVMNYNYVHSKKIFTNIKHRFFTHEDIAKLFRALHLVYNKEGTLKNIFQKLYGKEQSIKNSIAAFSNLMVELIANKHEVSHGIKFMFPDPEKGSACKRMNLFLRWMVRKDELDFGLWDGIPTSQLIIPVDTHVAKICRMLKLTHRKNVSWQMAEEITEELKILDPDDPVKYDFAICHIGMRKIPL